MSKSRQTFAFAFAAMRYWGHVLLGLSGAAGALAAPFGTPLSPGTSFVECTADGNSAFNERQCDVGGVVSIPAHANAEANLITAPPGVVTLAPPNVHADAESPENAVFGAGARAGLSYSFQVIGGNPGDIVPIRIQTILFANAAFGSPDTWARAELSYRTSVDGVLPHFVTVCTDTCPDTSFNGSFQTIAASGSLNDFVAITVSAHSAASGQLEHASAFADPYIYIDPDFANASLYSIVVSPGVGNVPATDVPEPASATLFAVATLFFAAALGKRMAIKERLGLFPAVWR